MITADELRLIAHYDAATGEFTWFENARYRKNAAGKKPRGKLVSYAQVTVRGERYLTHRLAWLWVHGEFPKHYLDHINGDRSGNRISNLRQATPQQNNVNRGKNKNNSTGYKGVSINRFGRYMAKIEVMGRQMYLGLFDTPVEAYEAYCAAAVRFHGEFAKAA